MTLIGRNMFATRAVARSCRAARVVFGVSMRQPGTNARQTRSRLARGCSRVLILASALGCLNGCAGDDTNPPLPDSGPSDAAFGGAAADAPHDATSPDAQALVAAVRVAHWSPDAPPVDFCIAGHGASNFGPPLLAQAARIADAGTATDSGAPGLSFPNVSSYFHLPPGDYDVRVVVGGATDCATNVAPDLTTLGGLTPASLATIALIGEAHPNNGTSPVVALAAYRDDVEPKGALGLRVINAAPSLGATDFGTGTIAHGFKALFTGVAFGAAGGAGDAGAADASASVDPNGYASLGALANVTLSAHQDGATIDSAVATGVSAASGSLLTIVLLQGSGSTTWMLDCVDNAGTLGVLGSCTLATE